MPPQFTFRTVAMILVLAGWVERLPAALYPERGRICGRAVNGTQNDRPLASAEIVLRAVRGSELVLLAKTVSDDDGWFAFEGLALDGTTYLPGSNFQGVHYPGSRVRLTQANPSANLRLVAFEARPAPSPLVCPRHEIMARVEGDRVEVTESMQIENPGRTTYVGQAQGERPPVTLSLRLPGDFDKVTFDSEFHGRSFYALDGVLHTDLPWPPGSHKLQFVYQLPLHRGGALLRRHLDQPTGELNIRIVGVEPPDLTCNLPVMEMAAGQREVSYGGKNLPAGTELEVRHAGLGISWELAARIGAVATLVLCMAVAMRRFGRRPAPSSLQAARLPPEHGRRRPRFNALSRRR